jgi:hypothetical protein
VLDRLARLWRNKGLGALFHLDDSSTPAACTWTIQAHIMFHVQSNWGRVASLIGRKNDWIIDLGRIESLALTLKDAAGCQKAFALRGAPLERRCIGKFPSTGGSRG